MNEHHKKTPGLHKLEPEVKRMTILARKNVAVQTKRQRLLLRVVTLKINCKRFADKPNKKVVLKKQKRPQH